ncbi:LysE family transporter [Castellaniella daejeonensis]|jgi:homoserine/homoserine lactone efflux protein|uniref:LysE family transporter n=1 Tax=Castellaniella daejeonensis TaxID=659013 RepID=A0ABP3DF13_9BURK|nr:LysE family transporter [Castellaniella sp.]HET8702385.1 LysE family transporter [Castellaniella sp.]
MALSTWLAFFAAAWAISFSPGPGAICSMASGLKYGFRHGAWTIFGLQAGIICQLIIVALGVGALLATSEVAFTIVKWIGAVYLVYLGVRQFRTDAAPVAVEAQPPKSAHPIRDQLLRGYLVNVTNPKGTMFLLAVVPQFLDLGRPLPLQYFLIGATLCFTDLVAMSCYTSLASRILRMLRKPGHIRWLNRGFGSMFILAGTVLASFSHKH